ncbi:MAG: hypothetical protein WC663_05390 [Patescibacteria group bacterium]|jgi:hypothetical protein
MADKKDTGFCVKTLGEGNDKVSFIACSTCGEKMFGVLCDQCVGNHVYFIGHSPNCTSEFAKVASKHEGHAIRGEKSELNEICVDVVTKDGIKDYVVKCRICDQQLIVFHCERCDERIIHGHTADCDSESAQVLRRHDGHPCHEVTG